MQNNQMEIFELKSIIIKVKTEQMGLRAEQRGRRKESVTQMRAIDTNQSEQQRENIDLKIIEPVGL